MIDTPMLILLGIVVAALVAGSGASLIIARVATTEKGRKLATNLRARMTAWWVMAGIFGASILTGGVATVVLFGIMSFLALREFVTLTPTRRGDHRALFWAFFVIIPLQYVFVGMKYYGMFSIFIPVYAFLLIPARIALAGETTDYLTRTSKIQWGLMTCVYFISYVPALLALPIRDFEGSNATLLFFFVLIVQLNDVFQYITGNLFGRRKVAPHVSPNKTLEGLVGGLIVSTIIGAALSWATPFSPLAAAGLALAIATMGFLGDLTMSAVKRDLGVKDCSAMLPGHGGVLDRLDSVTFAAPLFFHIVRFCYTD